LLFPARKAGFDVAEGEIASFRLPPSSRVIHLQYNAGECLRLSTTSKAVKKAEMWPVHRCFFAAERSYDMRADIPRGIESIA
jgi:hypothetical protein